MWSKKWKTLLLLEKTGVVIVLFFIYQNISFLKSNLNSNSITSINELHILFIALILLIGFVSVVQLLWFIKHNEKQTIDNTNDKTHTSEETVANDSSLNTQKTIDEKLAQLRLEVMAHISISAKLESFINLLAKNVGASQGAVFLAKKDKEVRKLSFVAGYAYYLPESKPLEFEFGEGLTGQVAIDKKMINLTNVLETTPIFSGLGSALPTSLIICPVKHLDETEGVFELASFKAFSKEDEVYIEKAAELLNEIIVESNKKNS